MKNYQIVFICLFSLFIFGCATPHTPQNVATDEDDRPISQEDMECLVCIEEYTPYTALLPSTLMPVGKEFDIQFSEPLERVYMSEDYWSYLAGEVSDEVEIIIGDLNERVTIIVIKLNKRTIARVKRAGTVCGTYEVFPKNT